MTIRIAALPASDGDCLWVEWPHGKRVHRLLIDGGRGRVATDRLRRLPAGDRHVDLVVCTHIDADHTDGLISLFTDPPAGLSVGEVWFNGRRHLRRELVGPRQGERLEWLLDKAAVAWNTSFGRDAVVVPDEGPLPVVHLPGLTLTLLAPTWRGLARLDAAWLQVVADADPLRPGPLQGPADPDRGVPLPDLVARAYSPDQSPANGSSIAFLAEHERGGRVLFAADAPAEALLGGLHRLSGPLPVPVDLCKAPHHGSAHNVSPDLIAALDCRHWLISTSGARHSHPDRRAVARIVTGVADPVLWFNYHGRTTEEYADPTVAARFRFRAVHPPRNLPGIELAVSAAGVQPAA